MKITIGISSGIAAYKVLDLIKILQSKGHDISVILTRSASKMISVNELKKLTGNKVYSKLFDENFDYKQILKDRKVEHIEVATNSDLFIIAPATANTIAKLAHGIADDFLSTTILATNSPILVCPSMNTNMWFHPATQNNIHILKSYGYYVMDPENGDLACGTVGAGRLPIVENIAKETEIILSRAKSMKGIKVIVTAGGTIEPLDSARVLTNRSTGKMGIALADECFRRGAEVLLVRSAQSITSYFPFQQITFQSAKNLEDILKKKVKSFNYLIHAAAVSDFTIDTIDNKLNSANPVNLTLKPTKKIINEIKKWNPNIKLVGFKAVHGIHEEKLMSTIQKKFEENDADYIVVNDISRGDVGFGTDDNEVYIFSKNGSTQKIQKASKKEIANRIIEKII